MRERERERERLGRRRKGGEIQSLVSTPNAALPRLICGVSESVAGIPRSPVCAESLHGLGLSEPARLRNVAPGDTGGA